MTVRPPDGDAPPAPEAQVEAVLRQRAAELARAREEARPTEHRVLLPLEISGERYAVEALRVHQVLDAAGLHPILGAPRGVVGAIVARARPVPVLDLRHLLGLEESGLVDLRRVVVVEDGEDLYGIAVEAIFRRLEVPADEVRAAPPGPFLWLAPGHVPVLDVSRLGAGAGGA